MARSPFLSVIVPCYNTAGYVRQTVQSVLHQAGTPVDLEVIVVDDGSNDDPRSQLQGLDSRVRYVRQANRGVAAARNVGIALAAGRYVAFLDSDDYWMPSHFQNVLPQLDPEHPGLVVSDFFYETDGQLAPQSHYVARNLKSLFDLPVDEQYRLALEDNFISSMVIMPRWLAKMTGGFDETLRYAQDFDLWLRCLQRGFPVRLAPAPTAVYRYQRPGSTTTTWNSEKLRCRVRILKRHRAAVSARRWRRMTSFLAYVQFREALQRRNVPSIARNLLSLAAHPGYCLNILRNGKPAAA